MDDNRKKALAAALQQIERQFGKGAIMRMGDGTAAEGIQTVSTGSIPTDRPKFTHPAVLSNDRSSDIRHPF